MRLCKMPQRIDDGDKSVFEPCGDRHATGANLCCPSRNNWLLPSGSPVALRDKRLRTCGRVPSRRGVVFFRTRPPAQNRYPRCARAVVEFAPPRSPSPARLRPPPGPPIAAATSQISAERSIAGSFRRNNSGISMDFRTDRASYFLRSGCRFDD